MKGPRLQGTWDKVKAVNIDTHGLDIRPSDGVKDLEARERDAFRLDGEDYLCESPRY